MDLVWYAADIKTGVVQAELPVYSSGGPIERTVSAAMSSQVTLQTKARTCPADWYDLFARKRTMLVPVLDGDPLHGFIPFKPDNGDHDVPVTMMSFEHVLWSAYCRTHYFDGSVDESRILETLITDVIAGRFGLDMEVTDCGRTSEQEYDYYEDRVVGAIADELSGRLGGPEWTTRIRWADDAHTTFAKVVEIGPRIGADVGVVLENAHLLERSVPNDWTNFSNAIQAVGEGSGEDRPMSPLLVDAGAVERGEPIWEDRVLAATLDTESALTEYGEAVLRARAQGSKQWAMRLDLTRVGTPRPGRDFDAGDTVQMQLEPTHRDESSWFGPARLIGWRMESSVNAVTSFSPVFWDPSELEVTPP